MILHRVDSFPAVCDRTTADNSITNFDVFWETYREQYPFFHLHHVDWQATRDHFRPRVIHASPPELFGVLRAMIEPLHDHHTYIYSTTDTSLDYGGERPDPDPIGDTGRARALEIIQNRFLVVPLRSLANGQVLFGMLRDSIGYLRVMRFGAYYPDRSYERQGEDRFAADLRGWTPRSTRSSRPPLDGEGSSSTCGSVTVVPVHSAWRSPAGWRRRLTRLMP